MLPDNSLIGRYEIRRRVAHGGMGTLYLAQDPVLGRPVAVKLFLGDLDLPDARERFQREARAAAALNHPNIVTIYDYGEFSSQPYIVMEFIQGETLAELIRRRTELPLWTKLRWMEELCSAVEYAHAHSVIHRDLKPLNLMVDAYGRLKVLDFGIARMRGTLVSHATARIGTAGYMAPEQIRGGNIDHRSDLFSIGVVCYELISYVEPFAADVDVAITNRILEEEPKPLHEVDPAIDAGLADLVWKALRKDPDSRFQDAESMRKALALVRRQVEATASDSAVRHRPPPAVLGTGSIPRMTPRREGDAADKRAAREALVKERTAQIQTSLQLARESLEAGQLPSARAECERVLGLDNAQPEALELLRRIDLAMARGQATALVKQGHEELERGAITKAVEFLDRARGLTPDNPEVGRLDRALRIARAQQDVNRRRAERFRLVLKAAEEALDRGAPEEALGHAHEALEIDAASEVALALETEALRRIDEAIGPSPDAAAATFERRPTGPSDPTMLAQGPGQGSGGPQPAVKSGKASGPVVGRTKPTDQQKKSAAFATRLARLPETWRKVPARQRIAILTGAAAIVALVAALVVWAPWRAAPAPPPPTEVALPPPVLVVIDAVPWALITGVQKDGGSAEKLPQDPYTPLQLGLAPGNYTVTLQGPDGVTRSRPCAIEATATRCSSVPDEFEQMTAEKYFGEFLKAKPAQTSGAGR